MTSVGSAGARALQAFDRLDDRVATSLAIAGSRPPFDSAWIRRQASQRALPVWFAVISLTPILGLLRKPDTLFLDARLYLDATRTWLNGGDPWSVSYLGIGYAAPPPSLVPLVPFALLPQPADWIVLGHLGVAATVVTIRMLGLAWWWLLFPPVVQGATSGNVQMLLIPLILGGAGWLAALFKVYAIVPVAILGRWRQVVAFGVVLLVTAPFLPWPAYLDQYPQLSSRLDSQTGYGLPLAATVLLVPIVLPSLVVLGRERAAWLAVPALWPSQQWYYASLVLPVRSAIVGAIVASQSRGRGPSPWSCWQSSSGAAHASGARRPRPVTPLRRSRSRDRLPGRARPYLRVMPPRTTTSRIAEWTRRLPACC